jgi:NTP pyrophosphatase (non-canonical NTP hydrolase)
VRLREYQLRALGTDQVSDGEDEKGIIVPLLGLAGETGSLLTEYKKRFREGKAYQIFQGRISEELGDILWYVSNIASKAQLDLEEIASRNLQKIERRWLPPQKGLGGHRRLFDDAFPTHEQFPREFRIGIDEQTVQGRIKVAMQFNGEPLGDPLTDNSYEEDGYRYHDIFHLAYAAVLGWSPVIRKLMGRKRKSEPKMDEIEDGGRATAIEEGISALVFDYARDHSYFDNVDHVSFEILRTVKQLTRHLEVAECSEHEWQNAILQGFAVWRQFRSHRRGVLVGNLLKQTIDFEIAPTPERG